jgi:hypothetical protein
MPTASNIPDGGQPRRWVVISYLQENRFALLLLALVLLLFYGPIIDVLSPRIHVTGTRIIAAVIFSYLMIAGSFAVSKNRKQLRTATLLAVPAVVLEILDVALLRNDTQLLSHVFGMLFVGYVIVALLKLIFTSDHVSADTIFASLCVYLLLGTIWTYAYSLLEIFDPGAFWYSLAEEPGRRIMRLGAEPEGIEFYFSFVTMTTLGYGDIVPATPAARSLATLQAVMGQLYLAVLVARLVGMHVAETTRH